MERRISQIATITGIFLSVACLSAQSSSVKNIRFSLWADLDAYPGLVLPDDSGSKTDTSLNNIFDYSVNELKKIAPFLIEGMVYGWNFSYTPYDKIRAVPEYFEYSAIRNLDINSDKILYTKPWIEDNRLCVWVEFERSEYMLEYYNHWQSVIYPEIRGIGKGEISDGFDGIQAATKEALKDAVRTYFRSQVKNKPKRIDGKVIILGQPRLYTDSGQYVVELDFFLETDKIVNYHQF